MSLPVYYDSDLTGLTDSVREGGSKRNERGGGEEKLIQPNTLPPLCRAEADAWRTSSFFPAWQKEMGEGSNCIVLHPQQNVKFSSLTKA